MWVCSLKKSLPCKYKLLCVTWGLLAAVVAVRGSCAFVRCVQGHLALT